MRQTQSLMAEEWLYVMLRTHWGEYRWLSFEEGGGGVRCWRPLPPMPLHSIGAACASLGSKIYLIGGSHGGSASRSVCRYDSRTNRWEMAAQLRVPREFAAAGSVDGLLYVVGGCSPVAGSLAWAEVYDPLADKWTVVASPVERRERWMHGYATLDKKLFAVADTGGVVFDPASASWNAISAALDRGWRGRAAVVKGILFSPDYLGKIMGYDLAKDDWQELEGVQLGLPKLTSIVTLCAVSDKLYVLGERPLRGRESELAVAAVEVEKGPNRLEGRVLWSHVSPCNMSVAAIIHCLPVRL
ncbi:hypothetical protein O6H91_01G008700 [Diphasiastrum complanatum]|nr:hypothetical protein O6H91_01G008700 [Diphasiastrum complanatum]